ncbi:hypothetical protein O1611_g3132 [Lasiodiplodia mahajangana]|uniref:Uncharacterized protein n=1 Tax=Lasiodiplodia mahajangana TaxID=1108764 RepID=A0ACC2JSW7_9PEZI|nr:hypothetical protein O1611_g3132 [Lasiodiplodia mahajangana]
MHNLYQAQVPVHFAVQTVLGYKISFVLVPTIGGAKVTDIHRNVISRLSFEEFQRDFKDLYGSLNTGGCEAVVSGNTTGPNAASRLELRYARNTPMGNHAGENVLLESTECVVTIYRRPHQSVAIECSQFSQYNIVLAINIPSDMSIKIV